MKRIAVFGGGGFLGVNFCKLLQDCNPSQFSRNKYDFTIFTKDINDRIINAGLEDKTVIMDLINFDANKLGEYGEFDTIVYMATRLHSSHRYNPDLHKDYRINVQTPIKIMNYLKHKGMYNKKMIYISSLLVYGLQKTSFTLSENDFPKPDTNYATSKRIAELELIDRFTDTFEKYRIVILRPSFIYGLQQHKENAIPTIAKKIIKNESIVLTGNGMEWRDDVYVDDVSRAIEMHCDDNDRYGIHGDIFNIGGGDQYTIAQMTNVMCGIEGVDYDKIVTFNDEKKSEKWKNITLNIDKSFRVFGWSPKVKKEDGLRIVIDEQRRFINEKN